MTTPIERSAKRDAAVLAIAPIVLALTPAGIAELTVLGSAYLTDSELEQLHAIVAKVERKLK